MIAGTNDTTEEPLVKKTHFGYSRRGMHMKRLIIGSLAALAALVSVGIPIASADPGDRCESKWNTMYTVPIGVRTTCYHPDGSYKMCSSLGTDGNGPGTAGTTRLPRR